MKSLTIAIITLLAVSIFFDAPVAEAAGRKRRGSSQTRSSRRAKSRGTRAPRKVTPAVNPQIAAREKFVRVVADRLFNECLAYGQSRGKNDIEKNYYSRRCLALGVIKLKTSVIGLMRKAGKPTPEIAEHMDDLYYLNSAFSMNTIQGMEPYDTMNLYYSAYTNKKLQQDLLFPIK